MQPMQRVYLGCTVFRNGHDDASRCYEVPISSGYATHGICLVGRFRNAARQRLGPTDPPGCQSVHGYVEVVVLEDRGDTVDVNCGGTHLRVQSNQLWEDDAT